MKNNGI